MLTLIFVILLVSVKVASSRAVKKHNQRSMENPVTSIFDIKDDNELIFTSNLIKITVIVGILLGIFLTIYCITFNAKIGMIDTKSKLDKANSKLQEIVDNYTKVHPEYKELFPDGNIYSLENEELVSTVSTYFPDLIAYNKHSENEARSALYNLKVTVRAYRNLEYNANKPLHVTKFLLFFGN